MDGNRIEIQNTTDRKPAMGKEKTMSYEEKSVGSTAFFKCEACPYMALAEDDIKFHLFTVHPDLAKSNGLADNIQIPCPGCTSIFDAEETLRTHLRNHHKMVIKDIKKMVKSLVQIALRNAKLKKEQKVDDPPSQPPVRQELPDVKMPPVIEIAPDIVNANSNLPKGVTFISMEELNKMSTPNFEKIDPKEIIQEASINIVYTNEVSNRRYISVSEANNSAGPCNMIQMSSVPPDLISSIQPHVPLSVQNSKSSSQAKESIDLSPMHHNPPHILKPEELNKDANVTSIDTKKETGITCLINGCVISLKEEKNILYHRKCHQNGMLVCTECAKIFRSVEALHTHLWKIHAIDLELPTCPECGYKTYKTYRLFNIHMKCHGTEKKRICPICSKPFKNFNQLSKHKLTHKKDAKPAVCSICKQGFSNERRLKLHVTTVHEKLKPYKCSHCDHTAARKEELKLHLRSHTGDKPYSCTECSYRCADHNAMRRHKKKHSKENLYKCKYCPYTTIQSTVFAAHMISNHPSNTSDVHRCPYCPFKSLSKDKYVLHLTSHTDKEGIQLLIEMTNDKAKPSWTIPSKEKTIEALPINEETKDAPVNEIPIEVYDCDSLSESMPENFSKSYCSTTPVIEQQIEYSKATNLSKDNSDCVMSESTTNTLLDCRQFPQQIPLQSLQMSYDSTQSNLHEFLATSVPMEQNRIPNSNVISLAQNHCSIAGSIGNNIMSNFPIRLPPAPRFSLCNQIMLKPVDKILSLPMNKVTPTQILPVPSSSNSPVNACIDDGAPRKKPKISVKSNLILKGPDQENMFHSRQKMAFRRLEDNQRFGLGGPVTFNNLITTQFMQLPPEPSLSESPNDLIPYPQEPMLGGTATTPVDSEMTQNPQIFTFNQQMNNSMTMLPPPDKIQTNDPSYIKLEATIKQNTQSPSLERMCTENLMSTNISREYKASPPLEDINKNMSEIKNEVKSDFYMTLNTDTNQSNRLTIIDQFLIDNIMGEQYSGHLDLPGVLQEIPEPQNEVIEIDDNSVDNKLLPRYDMNIPFESLCLMHNDFYFLDNEVPTNNESVSEMNRMIAEVPLVGQKENLEVPVESPSNDFPNFIHGKKDPMMNTSVRLTTNKINVKNIELMKN